jgi:UDP-glucose 4-epimerase
LKNGAILVTGGAGYIGSHVVQQLGESAEKVVILDNLGKGFRQAVTAGELVVGEVGDYALVSRLMAEHQIDTVMHFAAHTIVPESVALPLKYYGNNTCSTRNLLQACLDNSVKNFVFSSTAAVYGMPEDGYAGEDSPTRPINAYGTSKLMSEWMLRDVAAVNPLRYVVLRYFNVAGSDPEGRIGQATPGATLLTKVACEAMVGKRPHVSVFGSDYPTPDGTGVRDYLHVVDLASAHLRACGRTVRDLERGLWSRLFGPRSAAHGRGGRRATAHHPGRAAPCRRSGLSGGPRGSDPDGTRLAASLR